MIMTIPIKTVSEANARGHWRSRHRRSKAQRAAVQAHWFVASIHQLFVGAKLPSPWVVTLTRIAPSSGLDDDNLRSALKAVRDQVADELGLPNDRDPRVTWEYAQERGKARHYAVRVTVERRKAVAA